MKAVDAEINRGEPGDRGGARAESQCWSKPSRCRATRVWDGYGALGEVGPTGRCAVRAEVPGAKFQKDGLSGAAARTGGNHGRMQGSGYAGMIAPTGAVGLQEEVTRAPRMLFAGLALLVVSPPDWNRGTKSVPNFRTSCLPRAQVKFHAHKRRDARTECRDARTSPRTRAQIVGTPAQTLRTVAQSQG